MRSQLSLLDGLPPGNWRQHSQRYGRENPDGERVLSDPFAMRALFLYVTRSAGFGMIPLFDMFNHGFNSTENAFDGARRRVSLIAASRRSDQVAKRPSSEVTK